ncbi:MAG: hypothetical protein GY841_17020 [FCB group bacterium]|nr:hypothetical protein [FCB group bacterium]
MPNLALEVHKINQIKLGVTNNGFFGVGYFRGQATDPETGGRAMSCEYPANSHVENLWTGAIWVGAVVGRDTLVSTGAEVYNWGLAELWPDAGENSRMIRRSSQPFSIYYHPDAKSEEDVLTVYSDTLNDVNYVQIDPMDNRLHQPLNIEIKQNTYAWSYPYAEDFVLFDFEIKNIGEFPLKQCYIGILVEAIVFHRSRQGSDNTWLDDICGFKETVPSQIRPGEDTIRVAWVADNNGDPMGNMFDGSAATSVTATHVIRTPSDSLEYSFNWWITRFTPAKDWGPRQVTGGKPYRDFGPNFGTPLGDKNKYYMLSTREFDYDQLECAVTHTDQGFMPPHSDAEDYADGHNPIYLLSFGPFDVDPDSVLPVTMAYVGGEGFHHNPKAYREIYDPYNPKPYQDQLDFTDLGINALWADWIFDNPGYDTDGDGDSGKFIWKCEWDTTTWFSAEEYPGYNSPHDTIYDHCEKVYLAGDGVPDFRGAAPPPPPNLKVTSEYESLILRWNGQVTEEYIDIFSGQKDFEGYKVYYGEDNRPSDFVLLATYDRRNYNVYKWQPIIQRWEVSETPVDYDSLVAKYGREFDPDLYTMTNPLADDDSRNVDGLYTYFSPQNWNKSDLTDPYSIHKVYPDADPADPTDTTEDGLHRFYEYEYIIRNLAPVKPIFAAVTAFDYGSRTHYLSALETAPLSNAVYAWPMTSAAKVEEKGLGVYVYPNPYRIDGGYALAGYENRDRTKSAERARGIHFGNLPARCTIRIFTLSGDLVQKIEHEYEGDSPEAMHERWNMISRNTQAVTTGIYIWSVTSEMGEQVGKLVIMK